MFTRQPFPFGVRIMKIQTSVAAISLVVALAACGGAGHTMPPIGSAQTSNVPLQNMNPLSLAAAPLGAAQWGVGYLVQPLLAVDGLYWAPVYCANVGSTAADCPGVVPAKRTFSFSHSHRLGRPTYGSTGITVSGSVSMGSIAFSQTSDTHSPLTNPDMEDQSQFASAWDDVLTPEISAPTSIVAVSPQLKYGSPVQFTVTLAISNLTAEVPCTTWDYGSFTFQAAGNGTTGNAPTVSGACVGSTFVVTNGENQVSDSDTGVLNGKIGERLGIQMQGDGGGFVCIDQCGSASLTFGATATYTITPLTPGVSFKTASGNTY